MTAQPGRYASSVCTKISKAARDSCRDGGPAYPKTYLPLIQLILFRLVLLDQIVQHLLQAFGVRLERRHHVLDGPLDQDPVDHAEALALFGEWLQRV